MLKASLPIILILLISLVNIQSPASAESWVKSDISWSTQDRPVFTHNTSFFIPGVTGYHMSRINPDGTIGIWTTILCTLSTPYCYMSDYGTAVSVSSTHAYFTGGWEGFYGRLGYPQTCYTQFNPDGTFTYVTAGPHMNQPRDYHQSLIVGKYLYVFGGYNGEDFLGYELNSVEFAPINEDGSLGGFSYLSGFNKINGQVFGAFNLDTEIYCIGENGYAGKTYMEKAVVIGSNGVLSQWTTIWGPSDLRGLVVLTKDTGLFMVQLNGESGETWNRAWRNGLMTRNSLGNWVQGLHNQILRRGFSLTRWDRFIYVVGGFDVIGYQDARNIEMYDPLRTDANLYEEPEMVWTQQAVIQIP